MIELLQFAGSHFNEKARWTLDYKDVEHRRTTLLPGPHMVTTRRISGQAQTPVLRDDGEVIVGSARIIEHLERKFPEPALYPEDAEQRRAALEIQREFDAEVGPAVRLAKFFDVMDARYATQTFCADRGAAAQAAYHASFPLVFQVMKRMLHLDAEHARSARDRTREAFDFVAENAGANGYLVGDRFTIADLCCAALLMPAVAVAEWGGPVDGRGPKVDAWLERWSDHPGAEWVRETFRRHRSISGNCGAAR